MAATRCPRQQHVFQFVVNHQHRGTPDCAHGVGENPLVEQSDTPSLHYVPVATKAGGVELVVAAAHHHHAPPHRIQGV